MTACEIIDGDANTVDLLTALQEGGKAQSVGLIDIEDDDEIALPPMPCIRLRTRGNAPFIEAQHSRGHRRQNRAITLGSDLDAHLDQTIADLQKDLGPRKS